jgi:Na+/alanine symporter
VNQASVSQGSEKQTPVSQGSENQPNYAHLRPFLLMEGGPLYRIERRIGLIKANAPLTVRRAIFAAAFAWLPLLILSAIQGVAFGNKVQMPFLHDFSAYTRFLLAMPLLLLAEIILGPRIAETAEHFVTSGLITPAD